MASIYLSCLRILALFFLLFSLLFFGLLVFGECAIHHYPPRPEIEAQERWADCLYAFPYVVTPLLLSGALIVCERTLRKSW
jgi:hypothetical protein